MYIISVGNQKGGVGKTTTSIALADTLIQRNNSVLLIDMDPQASLTAYFKAQKEAAEKSVYRIFDNEFIFKNQHVCDLIIETEVDNVHLLASEQNLGNLERIAQNRKGLGLILRRALARISGEYDYVIIDCPPALNVLLVNALACCHQLLVPVQTEYLALKALDKMIQSVYMIQKSRKHAIPYFIVPTQFEHSDRASHLALTALSKLYPNNVWDKAIVNDHTFREASIKGVMPSTINKHTLGVIGYDTLCEEILNNQTKVMQRIANL